jgi:hypothetical protein
MFGFNFLVGALFEGTRVSSTLNSQIREYRNPAALPPLTPELKEIIAGCALGDLNIQKRYTNAVLRFIQGGCNREYRMHLYSLFEAYCGTPPKVRSYTHPLTGCTHSLISFSTLSSPIFNEFHELFYPEGLK